MVSCCINPSCKADFRSHDAGDLYALEAKTADTEFFWMCEDCAPEMALALGSNGGVEVWPRTAGRRQPPHPLRDLRLMRSRRRSSQHEAHAPLTRMPVVSSARAAAYNSGTREAA
jgi:hypothetical protein